MPWRDVPYSISPSHPIGREVATSRTEKRHLRPIARQAVVFFCMTSPSFLIGGIGGDSYRLGGVINTNLALLRIAYIYIHIYMITIRIIKWSTFSLSMESQVTLSWTPSGYPRFPLRHCRILPRLGEGGRAAAPVSTISSGRRPRLCASGCWWPWWLGDHVMEKSLSHDTILR